MAPKQIPPSIEEEAFNCPHCGAFTTQYWLDMYVNSRRNNLAPGVWREGDELYKKAEKQLNKTNEEKEIFETIKKRAQGMPFLDKSNCSYSETVIQNSYVSKCYNCEKLAFWLYDKLIWPPSSTGPVPNSDLPNEIKLDFEEASRILSISPRGAAALLRLCIQKLCKHIGEKGDNINEDIASLVGKGLNEKIQKALDVVRVVGNDAVHPGQIDLKDDFSTAYKLFDLVNIITDVFISQPKKIEDMYSSLPQEKKDDIEVRNQKALAKTKK